MAGARQSFFRTLHIKIAPSAVIQVNVTQCRQHKKENTTCNCKGPGCLFIIIFLLLHFVPHASFLRLSAAHCALSRPPPASSLQPHLALITTRNILAANTGPEEVTKSRQDVVMTPQKEEMTVANLFPRTGALRDLKRLLQVQKLDVGGQASARYPLL